MSISHRFKPNMYSYLLLIRFSGCQFSHHSYTLHSLTQLWPPTYRRKCKLRWVLHLFFEISRHHLYVYPRGCLCWRQCIINGIANVFFTLLKHLCHSSWNPSLFKKKKPLKSCPTFITFNPFLHCSDDHMIISLSVLVNTCCNDSSTWTWEHIYIYIYF